MQYQSQSPNMARPPDRRGARSVCAAAALIFLGTAALVYSTVAVRFAVNSDNMYFLLAAEDLLDGNVTLHGWHGGFFSALTGDIALAALLRTIAGRKAALYLAGPLSCAAIAAFAYLLIQRQTASKRESLVLTAPLIFLPRALWHPMSTLGMHAVSIAQIVILIYLCERIAVAESAPKGETTARTSVQPRTATRFLWMTLALTIGCVADGFVVYFCAAPLFVTALIDVAVSRRKTSVFFVLSAALGVGLARLTLSLLERCGGLTLARSTVEFVALSELGRYLGNAFDTFLRLFSPTPEKPFLSQRPFAQALSLFFGGAVIALAVYRAGTLIRNWKAEPFADKLLITAAAFTAGSFALTETTQGEAAFRYLAPACFLTLILAARTIGTFRRHALRWAGAAFALAAALIHLSLNPQLHPVSDVRLVEIADALKDRGVTHVYGTYWETLALNYYAGNAIQAAPVKGADGTVRPAEWSSKAEWYEPGFGARCLLVEENQRDGLSPELIAAFFGAEDELLIFHQVEIRCYDRNLSKLLSTQPTMEFE